MPYVVTIHDLSYLHFPELFKKEDVLQLTSWSKYSIENSAHVIVPSQSTKNDIVKNYKVLDSKISVTYEGYNKDLFKKKSKQQVETVKKKYKIAGDYVIFVGTIQPRKNIERLIEAFSKIKPKSVKLIIVGRKGWLYDAILKKSHDLGIQEEVIFTDFVPNEDLPPLISGSKAYINPSLWEGFGIPVVEAQACDVPVAVASTSSLPEIVGESGILFDPDSVESIKIALQKLITNEKFSRELIKKGQENVKRFSWEACAKETLAILTKVASN
ncbi:glycosyltransferase family 4 protein [Candidatus Curtissbacteria bacterium]|nr:glycosyltransferase family 4 protein [Candidatus Curtissbacteria bacterium]